MRNRRLGILLVLVGQTMLFAGLSSGQQDEALARVTILPVKAAPADARPVPIEVTLGRGIELGSLSMTIGFPIELVTFQKVELGGIAEGLGAEAKAELKEEKGESVVQLTIATPEKNGARMALPQGRLASLWFKVAKDAKPETVIPLTIVAATATGIKAGDGTVKLETRDGQIVVSHPLITACFFYMH